MVSGGLFQAYMNRLEEARLYFEQGLGEGAVEIFEQILSELAGSELPEKHRKDLSSLVQSELARVKETTIPSDAFPEEAVSEDARLADDPSQSFQYGLALQDGQFYEEAIREFKKTAVLGHQVLECWELCGDCASRLERFEEAIGYYEVIYSHPDVEDDLKRKILAKITKCSQTQKKKAVRSSLAIRVETPEPQSPPEDACGGGESEAGFVGSSITRLDQSSIHHLIGERIHSWRNEKGEYLSDKARSYVVLNVLHVGTSSTIVELEAEEGGKKYAGQTLTAMFNRFLAPASLFQWARMQMMLDSRHQVTIHDLAFSNDRYFIVREYLPLSFVELLSEGDAMPIPLATYFAHQILEGLGDLHLHMGRDERIRNIFHLDLRPSQILLHEDRPLLKLCNGGVWRQLQLCNPRETALQKLPLPFLAYRAPEQFRPYLARRKPPVFTDIYLFGTLFYEMLTGSPAFRASSFEEYEIQHCEQYPTPPKVWRPQLPDELNDIIMKCLESDPMKRWRSTTEVMLLLEKTFSNTTNPARDGSFNKFMNRSKMN